MSNRKSKKKSKQNTGNQKIKSKKKTKTISKNKTIEKTVKLYSKSLSSETIEKLEKILAFRQNCRNYFYSRYSGIKYYNKLDFWTIRNELIHNEPEVIKSFGLTSRAINLELSEALSNIKSMWSNLKNKVKHRILHNPNLSDKDRHYLYYVLKSDSIMYAILNKEEFKPTEELEKIKTDRTTRQLHQLLRRYIRKDKPKISHSNNLRTMMLDCQMYTVEESKGYISITNTERNNRIEVPLPDGDLSCLKGNIRIVLNKDESTLEFHRCIKVKSKTNPSKGKIVKLGIDKGKATLLSLSSGNEYGINIGKLFDEVSEYVNQKNKGRNQYHAQIKEIDKLLKTDLTDKEKNKLLKKRANIQNNNLSKNNHTRKLNKLKAHLESIINHAIREMIKKEKPTLIILEDLTFESKDKGFGKKFNRKMTMWMKGYLDERINYIASLYNVEVKYVSAAYTSKFCAECGAPLLGRSGTHFEIAKCANCGNLDANINAAKNILNRYGDHKLGLYVPYKSINTELLKRYEKKTKKDKSLKPLDEIQSMINSKKNK